MLFINNDINPSTIFIDGNINPSSALHLKSSLSLVLDSVEVCTTSPLPSLAILAFARPNSWLQVFVTLCSQDFIKSSYVSSCALSYTPSSVLRFISSSKPSPAPSLETSLQPIIVQGYTRPDSRLDPGLNPSFVPRYKTSYDSVSIPSTVRSEPWNYLTSWYPCVAYVPELLYLQSGLPSKMPSLEPSPSPRSLSSYVICSASTPEPSLDPSDGPSPVFVLKPSSCSSSFPHFLYWRLHLQCRIKIFTYHSSNITLMFQLIWYMFLFHQLSLPIMGLSLTGCHSLLLYCTEVCNLNEILSAGNLLFHGFLDIGIKLVIYCVLNAAFNPTALLVMILFWILGLCCYLEFSPISVPQLFLPLNNIYKWTPLVSHLSPFGNPFLPYSLLVYCMKQG